MIHRSTVNEDATTLDSEASSDPDEPTTHLPSEDPYDPHEEDPLLTNAIESQLWEYNLIRK